MIDWKDVSSYAKGDTERKPNAYQLELGKDRIVLHKHIHYGDEWLLTISAFGVDKNRLETNDVETAKIAAQKELVRILDNKIFEMQNFLREIDEN